MEILDCTIRDGGYVNDWRFDRQFVRETYRALSKSGVDYVELGFRGTKQHFDPEKYGLWRFCTEDVLAETVRNIKGAAVAVMGDFGKVELEDFPPRKDSAAELVRLAVHKSRVYDCIDFLERIKAKGYKVSLQCMGYTAYSDAERKELIDALSKTELDYVYIADSYGSLLPFEVHGLFEPMLSTGAFKVGFHPHNNIQMAFANTLEAMRTGIHIVDSTVYGIGRGAGNLPTEVLLSYLSRQGKERYNVIPVLNIIERFYLDQKLETPWGYRLQYMISGIFNSHPSYASELLKRREHSMEDIWKAMACVQEISPVGYDAALVDEILGRGYVGCRNVSQAAAEEEEAPVPDVPVRYRNRHADREFLVLANGPSLKENSADIARFIERYDPIVLGANFLSNLFAPHYHAFNNQKRFVDYIKTVDERSSLLLGTNFSEEFIKEYTDRFYESLVFRDVLYADFDICEGVIMTNCRTVSALLVGVAIVMGANRVFVAGMDGYIHTRDVNGTLFYKEKFDPQEHALNMERHRWNERFLQQMDDYLHGMGGEGVHIVTPTSHASFYKSIENYI